MAKEVTVRELAKRCGVSPATVSRVLSGSAPVRQETREKIEAAIRTAGYSLPNQRPPAGKTVAVVVPWMDHIFFQQVLSCLQALLARQGDTMVVLPGQGEALRRLKPDGVILLSEETEEDLIRQLQRQHISVVICGALPLSHLCPAVHVDDLAAAYDGTNYLLNLGHRQIGFLCDSPKAISAGFQRIAGCRKALEDRGLSLPEERIRTCESTFSGGYAGAKALLRKDPELTAIFAHSDAAALGAMAALADLGKQVPEQISVLGFDGTPAGAEVRPGLTCVAQPIEDIVRKSLELLYAGMDRPQWDTPPTITLPHSILVRDSVRQLPE